EKPAQSQSSSEDSSIASSSGSYPPNHRYQNCRDSDDELNYEESDIDDEDEDDEEIDYDDIYEDDGIVESKSTGISAAMVIAEDIDGSELQSGLPEREVKPNRHARDRSAYVHPVLNPVENLTQWKAVKGKRAPPLEQRKENLALVQEPRISFRSEPSFNELS